MEIPSRVDEQAAGPVAEAFRRLADLQGTDLISEEDVKNKAVLPMLRALGYEDADFNYERRTGRGYVDVAVERFPTAIVVEAKAPRTRLDQYREQLEGYVFNKHGRDRITVAILTDGESFNIYGVTGALWKGSLESYSVMSFRRSELRSPALEAELTALLGRQNNQNNAILDAIAACQKKRIDRLGSIEQELHESCEERQRIDTRIQELQAERTSLGITARASDSSDKAPPPFTSKLPAIPHILRLLDEKGARSKSEGVERKWLDEQLINKVDGVKTHEAVSFGLIKLRETGQIEYEGKPIRKVWLTSRSPALSTLTATL